MSAARWMGLAGWIFTGVLVGVAVGLFFGEDVGWLSMIGDAFVDLLQMTVLPYITFSLVASIGGLPRGGSRRLALAATGFLLASWAATLVAVVMIPQVLPPLESASFFSTGMLTEPASVDFVKLFIPANPFHALANNVVPAVVLFCICVGAAVMTLPRRRDMVDAINLLTDALARVNGFMVRLTPLGVFAISASTAGTMELAEFERLQAYMLIYAVAVLLLGGVILPGLLTALTPFSYGQVMRALRVPLITAFATGKVFIVLPMLVQQTEELFRGIPARSEEDAEERTRVVRAVTPLVYPFPHAGKLLALLFVPFAAWFVDRPLDALDYPVLLGAGLFSLFGSPVAAMPYLLNLLRLPADMFELFVVSGIFAARLGDALGAVHILFVTVLSTAAMHGLLRWRLGRLVPFLVTATVLWGMLLGGCRHLLDEVITDSYDTDALLTSMQTTVPEVPLTVLPTLSEPDPELAALPVLERVSRTGRLRIGYHPDNMPWTFTNTQGDLVGLDVDLAHLLAATLECELEFVPMAAWDASAELDEARYDVLMSGAVILDWRLKGIRYSDPYMQVTAGLVVRDHDRAAVTERVRSRRFEGFRLGVVEYIGPENVFQHLMPGCELVKRSHIQDYFDEEGEGFDGWLWAVESGSVWTLLYPAFSVVPLDPLYRLPVAIGVAVDQGEFAAYLDSWLAVVDGSGEQERLYGYWVLGEVEDEEKARWSLARDVLGWGE